MTLEIKRSATETTIKVVGSLDVFTAPVLEKMINKISCDSSNVVLELSGLEFISDSGISAILKTHERVSSTGSLRLVGVNDSVKAIFADDVRANVLSIN
jgi:anti-anti-sigma factor